MELLQVKSLPEPEMLYWKTWLFEFTNIVHKHAQANIYKAFLLDSCTHTHTHARTRTHTHTHTHTHTNTHTQGSVRLWNTKNNHSPHESLLVQIQGQIHHFL